jgi:hypothetical protein
MNPDLTEGLEKFLAWWLKELPKAGYRPRDSYELRQAFLDELGKRIDEFNFCQDWDEHFGGCMEEEE